MREPWETLLGQFRGHWFLGPYTDGTYQVPPIRSIIADERFWALSGGEQALIYAADAMLRIHECYLAVDETNQDRIDRALRIALDVS